MPNSQSIFRLLIRLWKHTSSRRRRQFILLLGLSVICSFAEIISLGAVFPFIGVLTEPERIFNSPYMVGVVQMLGVTSAADLILPLAIAFAIAALLAGSLRLLLLWVSVKLGNAIGTDFSIDVYLRTLYQPYSIHIAHSSSEIISGITQKVKSATGMLTAMMGLVTSAMMFASIMATLFTFEPLIAVIATFGFGSAYIIIAWIIRHKMVHNGQIIAREQTHVVKALQEGLGAIRDVLLDGVQTVYCNIYRKSAIQLLKAEVENVFMCGAPRFAMEAFGMVLIAVFALVLSHRPDGIKASLPIMGMMALGAQRLLPLMQQLYATWGAVAGSKATLIDVLALLDQPLPLEASLPEPLPLIMKDAISFDNVHFHYGSKGPWVLEGINLVIPKGAKIGIIGNTGCGKSTLLDLLMGLLEPTQGKILVDGKPISKELQRAWQRTIAHVPQTIYLADTNIASNIAFGVPPDQIDLERVRKAAGQARIAEFIESRSNGYNANVGERGVSLSGGQRQRIGIARALYKQAKVLIFDEATSALDNETEQAVMQAIEGLSEDLTIIIIAHRLSTLKNCDTIVQLEYGKMGARYTYDQLMNMDTNN